MIKLVNGIASCSGKPCEILSEYAALRASLKEAFVEKGVPVEKAEQMMEEAEEASRIAEKDIADQNVRMSLVINALSGSIAVLRQHGLWWEDI